MRSLVPIDRKSIARQQLVEHFGEARHFEHRAELDLLGQLALAPCAPIRPAPRTARAPPHIPTARRSSGTSPAGPCRPTLRSAPAPAPSSASSGRATGAARASPSPGFRPPPRCRRSDRAAPCRRRCRRCGTPPACCPPPRAPWCRAGAGARGPGRVAETRNWNSVRNRPMPSAPVIGSAAASSARPALTITLTCTPSLVLAGSVPDRGEFGAALLAQRHAMLEAGQQRPRRADDDAAVVAVDEDRLAFLDAVADVGQAADHRHADRARDDRHVRGQRAFLEQHALQPAAVIFEQLGRARGCARSAPRRG